jgi:hypothetical protein
VRRCLNNRLGFHRRFLAAPGLLLNRTDAGSTGSVIERSCRPMEGPGPV